MSMHKIVLASSNQGKIREFNEILGRDSPFEIVSQKNYDVDDAEETGLSFIENAILKARHASVKTSFPAIADDSGLCVPVLNGEPGIYSARYSGEHGNDEENNLKLLDKLKNQSDRKAYFVCCIAFCRYPTDPIPMIATGIWHGEIALKPQGNNGFGYDPLFFIPDFKQTAAQLDSAVKNSISHRAQALKNFKALFTQF